MPVKKHQDQTLLMKQHQFNEYSAINDNNIKDYFNYNTVFITAIVVNGKLKSINNSFVLRERFIRGNYHTYFYLLNGEINSYRFKINLTETEEDYNASNEDIKIMIKKYIKQGILYGKRIRAS